MTRRPRLLATLAASALLVAAPLLPATPAQAAPGPPGAPQYWFDDWDVYDLWDAGTRGQGITIAEIDTGVNASLSELRGRVLKGTDLGRGGDGRTDREIDEFGHGTAMASIMVARPGLLDITGLAPDAKILPIAVPLNGTTDANRPDRLSEAIRYGADHGAKIISMSLGGKRSEGSDTQSCPDDEQAAVFHALSKGAIVIASVGNTGPTRNAIEEPGVCLGVVSVGAVDSAGKVASFSARQPYLTLVAPGVEIASLGRVAGDAYSGDGTSQATAVVSGVAALVWSRYPRASGREIVTRILATLDKRGRGHSDAYGYGSLDGNAAVTARVPANAANPVYDTAAPFIKRAGAFDDTTSVGPPAPAPTRPGATGPVDIGSASRFTGTVLLGVAAALLGLVALIVLGAVGLRRRRAWAALPPAFAHPVGAATAPPAWPDPTTPAGAPPPAVSWPEPVAEPVPESSATDPQVRPRPRPTGWEPEGG